MAKNDRILLDGIVKQRLEISEASSTDRGELFQQIAIEELLKRFIPSREDIDVGWVDGPHDGGIDGIYIAVNGQLMSDVNSVLWPSSGIELEILIVTSKHYDGFKQAPLDSLHTTLTEWLDFSLDEDDLQGSYSEEVMRRRIDIYDAYMRSAHAIQSLQITVAYACRGNSAVLGESVKARSQQIVVTVYEHFHNAEVDFLFFGSSEILASIRQIPELHLNLRFSQVLLTDDSYLLLVNLEDFASFISDEKGNLRQEFFDSNVRDFMGRNPVNNDISRTLSDAKSPEFWWLNNGITILTTGAVVVGSVMSLSGVQIVNGLQTTECIFRYFKRNSARTNSGSVLVKVIQTKNEVVRDAIIRSTNNQTSVEAVSLYATDKVQRDIEEILRQSGVYYERRKNYHQNRQVSSDQVVSPLYLGSAYIALGLKNPVKAVSFGNGAIRNETAYKRVFRHGNDINVWNVVTHVLKLADQTLRSEYQGNRYVRRLIRNWRHVSGFFFIVRVFGSFGYSTQELASLNVKQLSVDLMRETVKFLLNSRAKSRRLKRWTASEVWDVAMLLASKFDINDMETWRPGTWHEQKSANTSFEDEDFAMKVDKLLPKQPWKPGAHLEVAERMGRSVKDVRRAIQFLISTGVRNRQKDGVVYDTEGLVLTFDRDRLGEDEVALLHRNNTLDSTQ